MSKYLGRADMLCPSNYGRVRTHAMQQVIGEALSQTVDITRSGFAPFRLTAFVRPVTPMSVEVGHEILGPADALWIGAFDASHRAATYRQSFHEPSLRIVVVDGVVLSGAV